MGSIRIKDLSAGLVDVKPQNHDWSAESYDIDGERAETGQWSYFEADQCESCDQWVNQDGAGHKDDCEIEDQRPESCEGPMMSYWYPIDSYGFDPEEAALTLARNHLPLCVVQVDGEYGLALTGGGMDLSWEICEAFIRLGFLPPVHFTDLPAMAGYKLTATHRLVIGACRASLRMQAQRARWGLKRLDALTATLRANGERAA